jgi:ABC-type nitrate/sulfonate/bicarbonate transport system substrate-binding protein
MRKHHVRFLPLIRSFVVITVIFGTALGAVASSSASSKTTKKVLSAKSALAYNRTKKFVLPSGLKGSAPSTVKIALGGGYATNYMALETAMGAGFFNAVDKRFNTTISFDLYGSSATSEPAFVAGTDQFIAIAPANQLAAVVGGQSQVALMNLELGFGAVVSAPLADEATRGSSIAAYGTSGNTWCQLSAAGATNTLLVLLAGENNISLPSVNLTTIGSTAGELPDIQSGKCQVVSGEANSAVLGEIEQVSYVLYDAPLPTKTIPLAGEQIGEGLDSSPAFISQYPKLTQAIVDATVRGLLFDQANGGNSDAIYKILPSAMTASLSIGAFAQNWQLLGTAFSTGRYDNGEFPTQAVNDTISLDEATKAIPVGSALNPGQDFLNKYTIQSYKDFNEVPPLKQAVGPNTLPSVVGEPSLEAATAYAALLGGAVPANTGPAKMR